MLPYGVVRFHHACQDIVHCVAIEHMCCVLAQFGVVREGGANKAFGAGILSSYGEMEHMASVRACRSLSIRPL